LYDIAMKLLTVPIVTLFLVSCASTVQESSNKNESSELLRIASTSHHKDGMNEVMKFSASGKNVTVALIWRNYSTALDSSITTWYGDMACPPAKYVVKNLSISIDDRVVNIPVATYRYLASQWMNELKSLGVTKRGRNINIYINIGDGSESWVASYLIEPTSGTLIAHEMYDGPDFHNQFL